MDVPTHSGGHLRRQDTHPLANYLIQLGLTSGARRAMRMRAEAILVAEHIALADCL